MTSAMEEFKWHCVDLNYQEMWFQYNLFRLYNYIRLNNALLISH